MFEGLAVTGNQEFHAHVVKCESVGERAWLALSH